MWKLKKPCVDCPFRRSSLKGWLGETRAREIIGGLTGGEHQSFYCHKTTVTSDTEEDSREVTEESQHCAGAAILLHKTKQPNMAMRLGYCYGDFDGAKLEEQTEVFNTEIEFINHHDWN